MATAIKVENLSKAYQIGQIGTGTISRDLERWWITSIMRKEDPYLKIGETNDRSVKGESDIVWSLRDMNFEIEQGDAVGIIGRNGAGKSTLLKVLSEVTSPSTGKINIKGRIASLLEVGTGFHPELTGRENIFLNGAILGMRKKEIQRQLDAIIDFSGVERYVDTPVKRYSSGMYVRLAFAVAAHLESEILIVDEVLSVGDAEFQKKCLGKMGEVSKGDGRTVLFVSHNMSAVSQLCTKGLLLKNGSVFVDDKIDIVIDRYLNESNTSFHFTAKDDEKKEVQILSVNFFNEREIEVNNFSHAEPIIIKLRIKNNSGDRGIRCNLAFLDLFDKLIFISRIELSIGYNILTATVPGNMLNPNNFKVSVAVDIPSVKLFDKLPEELYFEIVDLGTETGKSGDPDNGIIYSNVKWEMNK